MNYQNKPKKEPDTDSSDPKEKNPKNVTEYRVSGGVASAFEVTESLVHAVIVAILLLTIFFRISVVDGDSMNPTLENGNVLMISNFLYTPEQGDIVVLQPMTERLQKLIIKRVIATGGQTVDIDFNNWVVYVDGEAVALPREEYINYIDSLSMNDGNVSFPHTVPEGKVFVMGDNRNDSLDSRFSDVGDVDESLIVGHALFRLLPFNECKSLLK